MASLPQNRSVALQALRSVLREGRPLDDRADGLSRGLETRDRAFVRLLTATTLRRLGEIDLILKRLLDKPMPARLSVVHDVMRLGAAQSLYLEIPGHAVVNTSVELLKRGKLAPYAGLANAVLRRIAREGRALTRHIDAPRVNTPTWLWTAWAQAYGEDAARRIALAHMTVPTLDLTLRPDQDPKRWAAALEARILPTGTLRRHGGAVGELPGFAEGAWWAQDAAAALPARLLGDVAGKEVIDLCAAPGGKTLQLAAAGARVAAVDRCRRRLRRVAENLERCGLAGSVALIEDDAVHWRPQRPKDAVLLDAPCSATGTIRRHPDVARRKRPGDVAALAEKQAALLRAATEMVKPGGALVYCVCSLQPEEGEAHIEALLASEAPFERSPVAAKDIGGLAGCLTPRGEVRTLPHAEGAAHLGDKGGVDGFFIARLRRALP